LVLLEKTHHPLIESRFLKKAEAETYSNARVVLEKRKEDKAIGSAHIDFGVRSANCDDDEKEEGMKAQGGLIYTRLREYHVLSSPELRD
jgi:hypothetical protein